MTAEPTTLHPLIVLARRQYISEEERAKAEQAAHLKTAAAILRSALSPEHWAALGVDSAVEPKTSDKLIYFPFVFPVGDVSLSMYIGLFWNTQYAKPTIATILGNCALELQHPNIGRNNGTVPEVNAVTVGKFLESLPTWLKNHREYQLNLMRNDFRFEQHNFGNVDAWATKINNNPLLDATTRSEALAFLKNERHQIEERHRHWANVQRENEEKAAAEKQKKELELAQLKTLAQRYFDQQGAYADACRVWAMDETARLWLPTTLYEITYTALDLGSLALSRETDENTDSVALAGALREVLVHKTMTLSPDAVHREGTTAAPTWYVEVKRNGYLSPVSLPRVISVRPLELAATITEPVTYCRTFKEGHFYVNLPPTVQADPAPAPAEPEPWIVMLDVAELTGYRYNTNPEMFVDRSEMSVAAGDWEG